MEQVAQRLVLAHAIGPDRTRHALLALQAEFGHVPPAMIPTVATLLEIPRSQVYATLIRCPEFGGDTGGAHCLKICRGVHCRSNGAEQLVGQATARLGIDVGQTTPNQIVSLGQSFCFGNCNVGPTVQLDQRLYGRLNHDRFGALLDTVT